VTANAATGTSMFSGASVFHQTDQREDTRDTLATLSSDTGGKAFFDLGDLSEAFPKFSKITSATISSATICLRESSATGDGGQFT